MEHSGMRLQEGAKGLMDPVTSKRSYGPKSQSKVLACSCGQMVASCELVSKIVALFEGKNELEGIWGEPSE